MGGTSGSGLMTWELPVVMVKYQGKAPGNAKLPAAVHPGPTPGALLLASARRQLPTPAAAPGSLFCFQRSPSCQSHAEFHTAMDFQGQPQNAGSNYPDVATNAAPPPPPKEFCAVRPNIPHAPYFQGFTGMGNYNPFAFPHHFMHPSVPGGFAPPPQVIPGATIDLTDGSQKRPSIECVAEQSKPNKKKRASRKKVEIVDLDDTKDDVELLKNAGHWKDHWVIQLVTIRGEMQNTFSSAPKQGVDNWSRLHTKLVSMCPDFPKDSEACRKKWSSIYNDYKEDKAMNMRSGSQRSEKCRWYTLVDEFMYDRANVVSHAHASAVSPDGPKSDTMPVSDTNTTEQRSVECTSKSPEPKRKDDVFMERCLGVIRESSKSMMESLKRSDDMKIALLMSMQATMQKMVEKM